MIKRYSTIVKGKIITLDVDTRITPDDNFRSFFWDWYTLEKIVKHIAYYLAVWGRYSFVEGVGKEGTYTGDEHITEGGFRIIFYELAGKKV